VFDAETVKADAHDTIINQMGIGDKFYIVNTSNDYDYIIKVIDGVTYRSEECEDIKKHMITKAVIVGMTKMVTVGEEPPDHEYRENPVPVVTFRVDSVVENTDTNGSCFDPYDLTESHSIDIDSDWMEEDVFITLEDARAFVADFQENG
jgi:hypothetical protein